MIKFVQLFLKKCDIGAVSAFVILAKASVGEDGLFVVFVIPVEPSIFAFTC